ALRAIELVENQLFHQGMAVKVVTIPDEKDPDDFIRTHGREALEACLSHAEDFLAFKFSKALEKIDHLDSSEGRIKAVQVMAPMLVGTDNPVIRHEQLKWVSEQVRFPEETLYLEIKRLERLNNTYQNKKNYENRAIFPSQERYSSNRKRWATSPPRIRVE